MINKTKEEIVELLKKETLIEDDFRHTLGISTSKIAFILKKNYYEVLEKLKELKIEGIIENISFNGKNFWKLKNEKI